MYESAIYHMHVKNGDLYLNENSNEKPDIE